MYKYELSKKRPNCNRRYNARAVLKYAGWRRCCNTFASMGFALVGSEREWTVIDVRFAILSKGRINSWFRIVVVKLVRQTVSERRQDYASMTIDRPLQDSLQRKSTRVIAMIQTYTSPLYYIFTMSNTMSLPSFGDESGRCEESRDRSYARTLSLVSTSCHRLFIWNPSSLNDDHDGHTLDTSSKLQSITHYPCLPNLRACTHLILAQNTEAKHVSGKRI